MQWSSVIHFAILWYAFNFDIRGLHWQLGLPSRRCPAARLKAWASGATARFLGHPLPVPISPREIPMKPDMEPDKTERSHLEVGRDLFVKAPDLQAPRLPKWAQWRHHETSSLIEFDRSQRFRWKRIIYKIQKPYTRQLHDSGKTWITNINSIDLNSQGRFCSESNASQLSDRRSASG